MKDTKMQVQGLRSYIVVIDNRWVRDSQTFDADGIGNEEFENIDTENAKYDERWYDQNVQAYIGCVFAKNSKEAEAKMAEIEHYDPRILRAIEVSKEIAYTRANELQKMFQALYDAAEKINANMDDDCKEYEEILDEAVNIVNEMKNAGIVEDGIVTL